MNHGEVSPAIAKGLLLIHERLGAAHLPPSAIDESLSIATWNIREFDKKKRSVAAIHHPALQFNPDKFFSTPQDVMNFSSGQLIQSGQ